MSSRRRYRASRFGARTSISSGFLQTSSIPSSHRMRNPSDFSLSKIGNLRAEATVDDASNHRSRFHSPLDTEKKFDKDQHSPVVSGSNQKKDEENPQIGISDTKEPFKSNSNTEFSASQDDVPEINPLSKMEIQSAAQWRAVSGKVSWKLGKNEHSDKEPTNTARRTRAYKQRIHTKPRYRAR